MSLSLEERQARQPKFKGRRTKVAFRFDADIVEKVRLAASITGDTFNDWCQHALDAESSRAIEKDTAHLSARAAARRAKRAAADPQTDIETAIAKATDDPRRSGAKTARSNRTGD